MSAGPPVERRSVDRQVRYAKVYDEEILPAYAARFAGLLLRQVDAEPLPPGAHVLEVGCATGHLTRELARRLPPGGSLAAFEENDAFLPEARAKLASLPIAVPAPKISIEPAPPTALPIEDGAADLVVSNLIVAGNADAARTAAEMARVLFPGGRAVVTAPLRGTWAEFLDLFREVLREGGKRESLAALDRYIGALPDGEMLARWLEQAGFTDVRVEVDRWEVLFRSAREFFFAPLVEMGPLPRWKQLSGRGDEMQDAFFFTKEAIDTYFKGRVFAVSIAGASVSGRKPG